MPEIILMDNMLSIEKVCRGRICVGRKELIGGPGSVLGLPLDRGEKS